MTRDETIAFMHLVNLEFPNAFRHIKTEDDIDLITDLWWAAFKVFSPETAAFALEEYVSNVSEYAPQIGQIKSGIMQILKNRMKLPQTPFEEIWPKIKRAARCDMARAKIEFAKMPENVQKALGGPSTLVVIGNQYEEDADKWTRPRIEKQYNDVLEEEKMMYIDGRIPLETVKKQNTLPMYAGDRVAPKLGIDMSQFQMKE